MEHRIGKRTDFSLTGMTPILVGEQELLIVADANGALCALEDRCSHADVRLSEGSCGNGEVECCAHGARFDVRSGKALCMPAVAPVATFPLRLDGDDVWVTLPE